MKEIIQETELKLSKSQRQNVMNDHVQNENRLNDFFSTNYPTNRRYYIENL